MLDLPPPYEKDRLGGVADQGEGTGYVAYGNTYMAYARFLAGGAGCDRFRWH